jgi:putative component of toxin-antitoxin plasmid stabilization module
MDLLGYGFRLYFRGGRSVVVMACGIDPTPCREAAIKVFFGSDFRLP